MTDTQTSSAPESPAGVTYRQLSAVPPLMSEYATAVKDLLPVVGPSRSAKGLPDVGYEVRGVTVDVHQLAAYASATGLRFGSELPLTFPYILSFPLALKIMTHPAFPFTAVGTVHLTNTIEQTRPLTVDDTLDIRVHAENLRRHRKGVLVDLVTEIEVDSTLVWRQVSAFLGKGVKLSSSAPAAVREAEPTNGLSLPTPEEPTAAPTATWRVDRSEITNYANASGDKNPIHVSTLGAKAFGFPTTIAHGMWSAAALLRGVEGTVPTAARYTVEFAKPITLPSTVAYFAHRDGDAWSIQLRKASKLSVLHANARLESL